MRKLATVRKIDDVRAIEGADAIECAVIGGWTVVVKRGEFTAGDLAVYLEIDSWVPTELAPFLSKGQEPREYNGIKGERLRTVKLRGQVSQGLLLPLSVVPDKLQQHPSFWDQIIGFDVSEALGIQKWVAEVPAQLAGEVEGVFPSFIPKTDQERIQNLTTELDTWKAENLTWEVTEKLDGSSMTVFLKDDHFGVCSRNWELRETEGNTLWHVARRYDLEAVLRDRGNFALQGELIGEGIQGNPYKIKGQEFYIFDIYDIDNGCYLTPIERKVFVGTRALRHVPIFKTAEVLNSDVAGLLKSAEAKSVLGGNTSPEREGLVYKCNENVDLSFKVISNKFLLKTNG